MGYQIIPYSQKYKTSLIKLLGYMWKNLSEDQIKEKFEWRYELNPFQERAFINIAIDEMENVVGFRAFVVQDFCFQNEQIRVYNPADAIIHPEHRRKGLFSKLTDTLIETVSDNEHRGIILNLSSNEKSTPGYLKLGWRRTSGKKKYGYKISVKNLLVGRQERDFQEIKERTKYGGFELLYGIKAEKLGKSIFHLTDSADTFQNCRSEAYYRWRYEQVPDKEGYFFAYLIDEEKIVAYAIIKEQSIKQFSLMEYGAESKSSLKYLLNKMTKKVKIPILRSWMINQRHHEVLRQCGFRAEKPWMLKLLKKERLPVLVRPAVDSLTDEDFFVNGNNILDINNWNIYIADSH